jgi:DNA-binding NtrC family response regulator
MTDGLNLCSSAKMQPIRDLVAKVAATNTTVLIRGESGVGKEVVARALHKASPRAQKQFL